MSRLRRMLLSVALFATLLLGAVVTVVFLLGGDPLAGRISTLSVELDRKIATLTRCC